MSNKLKFLIEASGSPVSSYMMKAIQDAGHSVVASDISDECAASVIADEFLIFPKKNDPLLWEKVEICLIKNKVDIVIPSFDEMLLGWAERKEYFSNKGIQILISNVDTIRIFQDKWLTAQFFEKHGFPCAKSSLDPIYPLVKPRFGRGSMGVYIENNPCERKKKFSEQDISQSVLTGEEYTVDCLFDAKGKPMYIVPRKRLGVINGKSTGGVVENIPEIESYITKLASYINFIGPINIQCFVNKEDVFIVEVNPRIAGGMALGFAATENWIPLFIDILQCKNVIPQNTIKWGMKMFRTYEEFYTQ